jgi:thiol-disulfide isomerase/thioredoxin
MRTSSSLCRAALAFAALAVSTISPPGPTSGSFAGLSDGPVRAARAGEQERPWLGLSIEKGQAGVRVREVLPDSPCASADVHAGDEVLSLDDTPLSSPSELIAAVQKARSGARVTLRLRSPQGAERKVPIALAPRPNLGEWQRKGLLGKQAPDFTPKVLAGPPSPSLAALRGEVVLLDFFASWCGPCMRSIPGLNALHQRYAGRGLRVVGVSAETPDLIGKVVREHNPTYTVAQDAGEIGTRAYRIHAFPTLLLIDRKGVIRAVTSDLDEIAQKVPALLTEDGGKEAGR